MVVQSAMIEFDEMTNPHCSTSKDSWFIWLCCHKTGHVLWGAPRLSVIERHCLRIVWIAGDLRSFPGNWLSVTFFLKLKRSIQCDEICSKRWHSCPKNHATRNHKGLFWQAIWSDNFWRSYNSISRMVCGVQDLGITSIKKSLNWCYKITGAKWIAQTCWHFVGPAGLALVCDLKPSTIGYRLAAMRVDGMTVVRHDSDLTYTGCSMLHCRHHACAEQAVDDGKGLVGFWCCKVELNGRLKLVRLLHVQAWSLRWGLDACMQYEA